MKKFDLTPNVGRERKHTVITTEGIQCSRCRLESGLDNKECSQADKNPDDERARLSAPDMQDLQEVTSVRGQKRDCYQTSRNAKLEGPGRFSLGRTQKLIISQKEVIKILTEGLSRERARCSGANQAIQFQQLGKLSTSQLSRTVLRHTCDENSRRSYWTTISVID